jgi:hypothetical protein
LIQIKAARRFSARCFIGNVKGQLWSWEDDRENVKPKFTHGQDAGKVALALWLFIAPWMLNYGQVRLVVWNGNAVAVIVAASSIAAMLKFTTWEEWISIIAGFWLFASPWLLGYTSLLSPTVTLPAAANHVAVGLMLVILSLWELNVWELVTGKARNARGAPPNNTN